MRAASRADIANDVTIDWQQKGSMEDVLQWERDLLSKDVRPLSAVHIGARDVDLRHQIGVP